MNSNKLTADSFRGKISELKIKLTKQKEKTTEAQTEAKNQRLENLSNLTATCIAIIKIPETAPSESVTS